MAREWHSCTPSGVCVRPLPAAWLVDVVLAAASWLPVGLAALPGYGLATSTGAVTFNSLLQARTPPAARGRVLATFDLLWQLGRLGSSSLAASPPTCSESKPSITSVVHCYCSPPPSAGKVYTTSPTLPPATTELHREEPAGSGRLTHDVADLVSTSWTT